MSRKKENVISSELNITQTDISRAEELKDNMDSLTIFVDEEEDTEVSHSSGMPFIVGLYNFVDEIENNVIEFGKKSRDLSDFLYKVAKEYDNNDKMLKNNMGDNNDTEKKRY